MKKRIRKKNIKRRNCYTLKRKREQIHRILDLVLDINGLEERKQGKTGDLPTAFFDFSGHVATIGIEVFKDGWIPYAKQDIDMEHKLGKTYGDSMEEIEQALMEVRDAKQLPL